MKEIIHSPEYQTTVYNWNNTDKDYPRDKTIHALFEDQVRKTPESTALVFENTILTYSQLDKRANQLANKIRRDYKVHFGTELSTDVFIAVCLDRSADMVVSILAVLKSGAAYVPLDPEHPAERIGHIINDTSAQLIITQESYISKFKKYSTPLHIINVEDYELYREESTQSINIKLTPNNFSYIIYTSGTTGVPKGVVHSHISIVSSLYDNNIFNGCTNFSCKSSYIFAPSVREMFYPLINGHVLHILSNKITQDLNLLINACITFNIEVLYFVPAHLEVFIYAISQCDSNLKQKLNIKYICNCGDKITPAIVQKVIETLPNITLYNQYGFSESSQVSLQHMINSNTVLDSFVAIGKVAQNKKIYILDEYKHPVPIGVTGDLFVAGAGLAVKYVNNEELTNEKFILNPFATPSDILNGYTKMYKTGDLVQWLSDGNVKYIGRSDAQVKIRGFRIELCEVESKLLQISEIKEACVIAKVSQNNNQVYLSAYYVLRNINDSNLSEEYIRVCLSNSLPDYMIPQIFIRLDKMPLNRNGKLDKASLPEPLIKRNSLFIEPTTDTEKICYQIWLDIFNLENISLEDDFFKIGGNSILAIKLSYLLSTKLNKQITIAEIYKYPTIKKFSSYIETTASPSIQIESITLENYPLSFSQERLLFIEQYTGGTNAYHLPLLFEVNQDININLLKQSIILLANRHDVLRTLFKSSENGTYHQVVMNEEIKIQEHSSSSADIYSQIDSDVNRPFNLTTEYPLRICFYYNSKDNKYLLLINRHHIASDGWSRVILLKEITHYYNFLIGKSNDLGLANNSIQYRDYSYWQRHYISGSLLENQLNFWKKHLAGYEQFSLPTDKIRPKNIDYSGNTISVKLSHQLSQNLRTLASDNNCSLYVVLLSGFYVLLSKYSNSIDLAVGTPIANRQFNQLAEVIGFFVNTLAVRVRLNISEPIETLLKIVHNTITEAQLFQDLPFDKLVNSIELERSSSQHPIFQVMFNMIGFMNEDTHKEILSKSEYKTNQSAIFDITCEIDDSNQVLIVYFNYATSLYEELTIQRMIKHYQNILEQMVIRDNKPLANYNILSQEEYQTIIYDWNATDKAYPSNKTVHELFIEQATKTTDNIALVFEDTSLTYEDLDIRSNQLAHKIRRCYLQQTGNELKPDTLIALCLDRSVEMVIGILGTLKAGAAYVPLDSEFPDNRLNYIFNDIDSKLVITQSQHMAKLANLLPIEKEVLLLDISSYSSYEDEQKDTPRRGHTRIRKLSYAKELSNP